MRLVSEKQYRCRYNYLILTLKKSVIERAVFITASQPLIVISARMMASFVGGEEAYRFLIFPSYFGTINFFILGLTFLTFHRSQRFFLLDSANLPRRRHPRLLQRLGSSTSGRHNGRCGVHTRHIQFEQLCHQGEGRTNINDNCCRGECI